MRLSAVAALTLLTKGLHGQKQEAGGAARDLRRQSVSSWIISQDPAIELQAGATGTVW